MTDQGPGSLREHWDARFAGLGQDRPSWHQEVPTISLEWIERVAGPHAGIVDVGGGDSRLVDHLLEHGHHDITVVDISQQALNAAHARIGESPVHWEVADVREWQPARSFDVWHDRAAYHFLMDAGDQRTYWHVVRDSIPHGGHVIIATFADDGPEACSGLPVQRYSETAIVQAMGEGFSILDQRREEHLTPTGNKQSFVWTLALRT